MSNKEKNLDSVYFNLKWLSNIRVYQGLRQICVRLFINKLLVRNITVQGRPQKNK